MSKRYDSTFTPSWEEEVDKQCPGCDTLLTAGKFKMRYGTRNGQEGTIRNRRCRDCESNSSAQEFKLQTDISKQQMISFESDLKLLIGLVKGIRSDVDQMKMITSDHSARILKLESKVTESGQDDILDRLERR